MKQLLTITIVLSIFSACTTSKRINYVQDLDDVNPDSIYIPTHYEYKVQSGDLLYIRINTMEEQAQELFNPGIYQRSGTVSREMGGIHIIAYPVGLDGYVDLPVIGNVRVGDCTLIEIRQLIQEQVDIYFHDAQVVVRLVNYKITVLGEVKQPGEKRLFDEKVNILEVIGMAGDITYYGNRKNIKVIRHSNEGTHTFYVDLTDKNLLSSEHYFLQPNDIVYVEPVRNILFRVSAQDYSVLLTAVTSTITAVLLIMNLSR